MVMVLSHREERSVFLYIGLLVGMGFLGAYFFVLLLSPIVDPLIRIVFFLTGILLVISSLSLAYAKTRKERISLTIISGVFGGIHGYLDLALYLEGFMGIIMFAWIAAGLLLTFACFSWILE